MKKIVLLALFAIIICGCDGVDPLRFKGCIIISKYDMPYYNFTVKLTPSMRDSLHKDYKKFYVEKFEYDRYQIGDTIK